MRETRLRIPLVIMFVMLTALSCRTGIKSSNTEAWRDLYAVEVKEILRIGSEDLANDPYVFSGINDLRIDAADNVYALDRKEFMIKVFSPTGKYIKTYKDRNLLFLRPGEFPLRPMNLPAFRSPN